MSAMVHSRHCLPSPIGIALKRRNARNCQSRHGSPYSLLDKIANAQQYVWMFFISVTRLRLRSVRFLPVFAFHAMRTTAEVRAASGFRGGSLLPDRQWAFWTMTAWDSLDAMRLYMTTGSHKAAMPNLSRWCDEASVVYWDHQQDELPSWPEADRRMRENGRASRLRYPSSNHATLAYRPPRFAAAAPISSSALIAATPSKSGERQNRA